MRLHGLRQVHSRQEPRAQDGQEIRRHGRLYREKDRISEIFTDQGEDGFRDIEHEVCLELADKSNLIIATGGGALTFERNVRVFKGKDIIVLLDVPLERIRYRLRNDKVRPLLQRPDKNKAMTELYNKRYPLYKAASDVTVKGKNTPIQTTRAVMDAVRHFSLDYSDLK